jgi:hypothetical protein
VAFLFALNDFIQRHQDRGTETCTDVICKWDKPRKPSQPQLVSDLDFTTPASKKQCRVPSTPLAYEVKNEELEMDFVTLLQGDTCVATHVLPMPEKSAALPNFLDLLRSSGAQSVDEAVYLMPPLVSADLRDAVEVATRGQATNTEWKRQRIGRLTASKFGAASRCKSAGTSTVGAILGTTKFVQTAAMQHGIQHEDVARELYVELELSKHNRGKCRESGLILCEHNFRLAASPDAILSCSCCCEGLLEIKCTDKYKDLTVDEVARQKGYHFSPDENGKPMLKRSSVWFDQVQGQLYVTGRNWCDFVLFTLNGPPSVERIMLDSNWVELNVPKLNSFFDSKVLPCLLEQL